MLGEIETALKSMTRAEQKVARVVLASPYRVLRKSISLLAGEAGVSEPSVHSVAARARLRNRGDIAGWHYAGYYCQCRTGIGGWR
jgi:RpiR family carbohydrate utilization transcriptional regulator